MKYDHLVLLLSSLGRSKKIFFPIGLNIDVTKECNLCCKHCYFQHQNYQKELDIEGWVEKFEEIKENLPNIFSIDWIGGEPLLRPEIIEKGKEYFPINTIITNGTIPLPKWKDCVFFVSIDGTKEFHEQTRKENIYDKIKININRDDVDVYINFTINKINFNCLEEFLEEWSETKVQGVLFTFCTPIKNSGIDFSLDWEKRDIILEEIKRLKDKYKNFILNSYEIIDLMKHEKAKTVLKECIFRQGAYISLDPEGRDKSNCSMGENADCSKCGCIVPYFATYIKKQKIVQHPNFDKIFKNGL